MCITAALATALPAAGPARAQMKPDTAGIPTHEIEVRATPIKSFTRSDAPAAGGRLEWRGGLVLSSPSQHFGGWSGLALSDDGTSFLSVSDSGIWMKGELGYDGDRPEGVRTARIGALRTLADGALGRMRDRDAESIALASGTLSKGTAYIAFEQNDRIGVFALDKDGLGKPKSYLTMPAEASRMRLDGFEALAVLAGGPRKGALVGFAEIPLPGERYHRGWIWSDASAAPRSFAVPGIAGYSITDAASLPDGGVLILERRFRWLEGVRVRLRHLGPDGIAPGGVATGDVLLEAHNATHEIDNLEGMAISRGARGETVITLISDDNFNHFVQRTLLLQFTLKAKPEAASAATVPDETER